MKIAILGYGKMGKTIERIAQSRDHEVVIRATSDDKVDNPDVLTPADVALEFTTPTEAYNNVLMCFEAGIPVVSGTTGWKEQLEKIKEQCRQMDQSFFYASNFSVGMNVVFQLNKVLARWMDQLQQYNVAISETHHTQKKDAPSGTAVTLANDLLTELAQKSTWETIETEDDKERYPSPKKRNETLKVTAYREADVPGIHQIIYNSPFDQIEIKHTAHSRDGFALGAVLAAEFLQNKKGVYGMTDLLEF